MKTTNARIISEGKRSSEARADWWISGTFCCQGAAKLGGVGRDELDRKPYTQKPMCFEAHSLSIPNSGETGTSAEHFSIQTLPMLTKEDVFQIGRSYELFELQIKTLSLIFCSYVIK